MNKAGIQEKGVVLLIVLATIFMVILLGNIVLGIVSSQSRLTHHKLSRIQAYYGTWAGINFALERLRTGVWTSANCADTGNPDTMGCLLSNYVQGYAGTFPNSIIDIRIVFCPSGKTCTSASTACNPPAGSGINFCINSTARYTYTP